MPTMCAPENPHTDQARFEEAWEKVDLVLAPATPSAAFAPGDITDPGTDVPERCVHRARHMAGLPAISVAAGPLVGRPAAWPLLIGKPFDEPTLFQVAHGSNKWPAASKRPVVVIVMATSLVRDVLRTWSSSCERCGENTAAQSKAESLCRDFGAINRLADSGAYRGF